jgi:hypothetical protein
MTTALLGRSGATYVQKPPPRGFLVRNSPDSPRVCAGARKNSQSAHSSRRPIRDESDSLALLTRHLMEHGCQPLHVPDNESLVLTLDNAVSGKAVQLSGHRLAMSTDATRDF